MTEKSVLIPGLRWTTLSTILSFIFSLVQTAILARLLSKADFAGVAIAAVFINIGLHLQNMGINAAIIQRPQHTREQLSSLYWLNILIGLVLLALGFGMAWISVNVYQSSNLWQIFMWYNLTFVANSLGVQYKVLLQKQLRFQTLAMVEIVASICGFGMTIATAWLSWGGLALVLGYLIRYLIESLGALLIGWRKFSPKFYFNALEIKAHGRFGAIFTAERLVTHFVSQLDVLLISRWLGMDATGVYDVFKRVLARPSVLLNLSIEKVAFPVLSNLQHDDEKTAQTYYKLLHMSSVIHLPLYIFAAMLAPWLVQWYFGEDWVLHIAIFQALCGFVIAYAWLNPVESLLLAKGKIHWQLFLYLGMAPFLAGTIWLGSQYGLLWTTWGIVAIQLVFTALAYGVLLPKLIVNNKKRLSQTVGQPFLLTLISLGIVLPLLWWQLDVLASFAFTGIYIILTLRFNPEFLNFAKAILKP